MPTSILSFLGPIAITKARAFSTGPVSRSAAAALLLAVAAGVAAAQTASRTPATGAAAAPASAAAAVVIGAGASFPGLVYTAWSAGYGSERGQSVRYTASGSGDGVAQIAARSVDFGATDSPLSPTELARSRLVQFPTMAGAIVPVSNGVVATGGAPLRLTGALLAALFAGDIVYWDDARIAAANPGLALPHLRVVRVVRADASGSTEILTRYLAQQSPGFATAVGAGKTVKWSAGDTAAAGTALVTARGNDGVASAVKATPGAIGYTSYDRVLRDALAPVALKNRAGVYVRPSEPAIQAAVRASDLRRSDTMTASLIDLDGRDVWPLVDLTYVLLDAEPPSAARASASAQFFYWAFLKGDVLVKGTGFAALPTEVQARVVRRLADIKPRDGKVELSRQDRGMPLAPAADTAGAAAAAGAG